MKPNKPKTHKGVWGLTGGIASGKSTAASFFQEGGIPIVDADQVNRELIGPEGKAHPLLIQEFGTADREKLRQIVFGQEEKRKKLESILHPLIRTQSQEKIQELLRDHPLVIYEATLLIEAGRHQEMQGVIIVHAPIETRIQRLMQKRSLKRNDALKIIDSQMNDKERNSYADYLVDNSGSLEDLRSAVFQIADALKN